MQLTVLGSSSAGNSAIVEVAGRRLLIDAGMSYRRLCALMQEVGIDPQTIDAVLVTHEHSDHTAGIAGMIGVPIYATAGTISAVQASVKKPLQWRQIPARGRWQIGEVAVESFPIPHDANEPVGYVIEQNSQRLVWALDMGHITPEVSPILMSATTLVLESNYCPRMLEADVRRPFSIKQRIRGRHGHLSNEDTYGYLTTHRSQNWQLVVLAHLSRECNDVETLETKYAAHDLPVMVIDPEGAPVRCGAVAGTLAQAIA